MVTALGLLDAGKVGLDTMVECPRTFPVRARPPVKNSDYFELGNVPFRTDFAKSCNTAFASLAPKLGPNGLADTGRTVGLGQQWDLGIDAFSGKVSSGGSDAERAAAAFGQGTTRSARWPSRASPPRSLAASGSSRRSCSTRPQPSRRRTARS